ncbi:HNH endonuclease [uncultured Leifsonia sp.]|uniref:HNH endonuclease n=1 Tax=uncultured Leifsonia sp. TaxID=340359 RepID=UPI0028D3EC0D|nr:HNH endonuclease [uncultured Leifsonia sp.]
MATKRGGRASQRMTELVLETYGRQCWLKLPGCKGVATTKDHVVPFSHGGEDALENYRPACRSCNSKRQNRVRPGYGASVVVVIGPPAGGKTTYVLAHAKPADVVIDMDRIARALMGAEPEQSHEYPDHVRHVAISARKAAIRTATRLRERVTVWLIHAVPTPQELAEYVGLGWQVITIDPGREVVEQRCRELRPEVMQLHVRRWYAEHATLTPSPPFAPAGRVAASKSEPDW